MILMLTMANVLNNVHILILLLLQLLLLLLVVFALYNVLINFILMCLTTVVGIALNYVLHALVLMDVLHVYKIAI